MKKIKMMSAKQAKKVLWVPRRIREMKWGYQEEEVNNGIQKKA